MHVAATGRDQAHTDARALQTAEDAWEPADWSAVLRRRRRNELAWLVVGVAVVITGVIGRAVLQRSPSIWAIVIAVAVALTVVQVAVSRYTARGSDAWEREARRACLVRHALRHHVSVGAADREHVTVSARRRRFWIPVLVVAVALSLVPGLLAVSDEGVTRADVIFLVAWATAICSWPLWLCFRTWRDAVRWLVDPLPRDVP